MPVFRVNSSSIGFDVYSAQMKRLTSVSVGAAAACGAAAGVVVDSAAGFVFVQPKALAAATRTVVSRGQVALLRV
jgi:seryl-tRNA(Sec) selenium transferase